ncbi:uncharacterized protein PHACADRAFT_253015 [Phanerochaete carnosa HHB-10118-sp]|uniref:Type 1 phosphatases regulator n=1 Tax=Phanerochaete carnosa (strain HHB-10118-sp) TaxID=650164 RepID=K5WHH9_PHACS|nr:uncharacterized protein PHACADRAFT_253015 [Phanerochaete carnosa HHB-10118-sp]EKM58569.1 hypothetical protein PHACADRAFT_253015 [Phanerochaete carnosa HHB-10118-sp]
MSMLPPSSSTSAPSDGSRTITIQDSQPREEEGANSGDEPEVGTLRLRGGPRERRRSRPSVIWREDVVDNEHMGKKSSKICCIYHKPKRFDESSSEESSDSDSDSSCDNRRACSRRSQPRDGADSRVGGEGTATRDGGSTTVHAVHEHDLELNAYERQPGRNLKKGKAPARSTSS